MIIIFVFTNTRNSRKTREHFYNKVLHERLKKSLRDAYCYTQKKFATTAIVRQPEASAQSKQMGGENAN